MRDTECTKFGMPLKDTCKNNDFANKMLKKYLHSKTQSIGAGKGGSLSFPGFEFNQLKFFLLSKDFFKVKFIFPSGLK